MGYESTPNCDWPFLSGNVLVADDLEPMDLLDENVAAHGITGCYFKKAAVGTNLALQANLYRREQTAKRLESILVQPLVGVICIGYLAMFRIVDCELGATR